MHVWVCMCVSYLADQGSVWTTNLRSVTVISSSSEMFTQDSFML